MKLSNYLSSMPRGGKSAFAKRIGISNSFLWQIASGKSQIPPEVAKKIEQQTKGIVKKSELRPDLWE